MLRKILRSRAGIPTLVVLMAGSVAVAADRGQAVKAEKSHKRVLTYYSEGKDVLLGVHVRASRLSQPDGFLPVYFVALNKAKRPMTLRREGIKLEFEDGRVVQLASGEEIDASYRRRLVDIEIAGDYRDLFRQRYPMPPRRWRDLSFYPLKASRFSPRTSIDVRSADLVTGYLYFRLPQGQDAGHENRDARCSARGH